MNSGILLSICIPTYNRDKYLDEALKSIIDQVSGDMEKIIEVCISDNASDDSTEDVVNKWIKIAKVSIIYKRQSKNKGADQNFLNVIKLSSGKYCWFLGSDDTLKDDAIKRLLLWLTLDKELYICNRTICDKNMIPRFNQCWLQKDIQDKEFDFRYNSQIFDYYKDARSLGALFSYLSSLVFKREKWNEIPDDRDFLGSAYIHVNKILSIVHNGAKLTYIRDPLVNCRGDNDSFSLNGEVNRFLIDFKGYALLADKFYATNPKFKKVFLKVLTYEHPWFRLVKIKSLSTEKEWQCIKKFLLYSGYSSKVIGICDFIGHFHNFVKLLLFIKRKFA